MSLYKGASDNHSPWEYVFASTLATLVFEDEKAPEKLTIAKVEALRKVFGVIRKYEAENFDRALIDAIMEKKAKMILEATTMGAIHEIAGLPKPRYDGVEWYTSKYSVPEEELILWSLASSKAPLIPEAVERYLTLFKQVYGYDPADYGK